MLALVTATAGLAQTPAAADPRQAMLDRARKADLGGQWTPPPVNPLSHYTAAYAQRLCSAVFIAGMDASVARQTLGDNNALAAVAHRINAGEPVIDRARSEVRISAPGGITRTARRVASQGCVILAEQGPALRFKPTVVRPNLPPAGTVAWPMGDRLPDKAPAGFDAAGVNAALDAAFAPTDGLTQAFVVTWKGQIIGERYGVGANQATPLEGWSMGNSVVASLLGVLMQQGAYNLDQPAPIPAWQAPGDPRRAIRIRDILQMSSSLRIRAEQDPNMLMTDGFPITGILTPRPTPSPSPPAGPSSGRRAR
ncbi:MAG TPA: hypothetical protein VFF48_10730 [Brevundimonas sp.]|nr:hypothetical protein [Brevundimonas sp.]